MAGLAKDLYTSPLFKAQRAYVDRLRRPWFILSAEHGLVAPDEWLSPYERYLPRPRPPTGLRREPSQLHASNSLPPLPGKVVELHAGSKYVDAIAGHLTAKGASLMTPLHGLSMGQRLYWYLPLNLQGMATSPTRDRNPRAPPRPHRSGKRSVTGVHAVLLALKAEIPLSARAGCAQSQQHAA